MKLLQKVIKSMILEASAIDVAEDVPWSAYQSNYDDWEKGIILSWGGLLYIGYHKLPNKESLVSRQMFQKEFEAAWHNRDDDDWMEDFSNWVTDMPPRYDDGKALFDKSSLTKIFQDIANKSILNKAIVLYRGYEGARSAGGWNSWSVMPNQYDHTNWKTFRVLPGAPLIFGHNIADDYEVIVNMTTLIQSGHAEEVEG
jgi:hypothetical protein